jgi:hypothetical protein
MLCSLFSIADLSARYNPSKARFTALEFGKNLYQYLFSNPRFLAVLGRRTCSSSYVICSDLAHRFYQLNVPAQKSIDQLRTTHLVEQFCLVKCFAHLVFG